MPVPTVEEVRAIVGTSTGHSDHIIAAFIEDATLVAGDCLSVYPESRQKAIVKWLAAHLVASTATGAAVSADKLGDASVTYQRATLAEGLRGTVYGQQALALDINGCLTGRGRARASVQVV